MPKDIPKTKGGKPKWVIPVGIATALGLIIVLRKRKPTQGKATEPGSEGLTNQSFIPVTGENVPGAGASYFPSSSSNNEGLLVNFLKEQHEEDVSRRSEEKQTGVESLQREREFFSTILGNLGTGGGAPTSSGGGGVVVAPPPEAGTAPGPAPQAPPPVAPPPAARCSGEFPDYNPLNGAPGPHSCYKYSRDRCSDKSHPYKHVYQDGHVVCSPT